jgi:PKD repeat protein
MRTLLLAAAVALVLAGCTATKDSTTSGTTAATSTSVAPPVEHKALLTAAPVNGTAPLNVTFSVDALGKDNRTTWRLSFGDGQDANGTAAQLPGNRTHGYAVGGNFTARLTVAYGGNVSANATVLVKVHAVAGADYPKVFTFGASKAGCIGDAYAADGVLNCINFQGGPDSPQVDGFWQALDARYTGKSFTSTITTASPAADSDCYFVAEDASTIVGDCTNGSDPAAGKVPAGAAWFFIYPYATPASEMVVTFA